MKNTILLIFGLFGFGLVGLAQPYDVVWTDLVNVTASGSSLTKTSPDGWNAGAFSENKMNSGTDGWLEVVAGATNTHEMIGFSTYNVDESYQTINYAIYFASLGRINIYEGGNSLGQQGNYQGGDIFRIERTGGVIEYKKNGVTFFTSSTPSSGDLYVDCSLYNNGSTIVSVVSSFDNPNGGGGNNNPSSSLWSQASNNTDIYFNTGNVGIGNDNPTSLLHVTAAAGTDKGLTIEQNGNTNFQVMGDGRVFAREVEVTLSNFPDYVFANDYDLMSLGKLRQYIEQNSHLPNIPSAAEIEEKGIGMGELNLKQVEKIEELTLYILQLDKRLQKLEKENAELKKELEERK